MNPLKWFRWKVLIVLVALGGGLYFLGLNPLARREINDVGTSGDLGARFSVEKVALAILQGRAGFDDFQLATNRKVEPGQEERERVARAAEMAFDLGMEDLLRKRFAVDEVSVVKPVLRIERRKDGTINIGDLGSKEPEAEKPAGKPTDWVGAINEWMEKVRKRVEERRREEEEAKRDPEAARKKKEKQDGLRADYARRVTYPFEDIPRVLVRSLKASALLIEFDDQTGALKPPAIQDGTVEITNLSDRPESVKEPIGFSISGKIDGAPIQISGTLDLRRIAETGIEKNDILLKVEAKGVPLQKVVQAFAGDSLPATFEDGKADLNAEVSLLSLDRLSVRAPGPDTPLFAIQGVRMSPKPGARIAGMDGQQFCRVVNEVGELSVNDLEIGGTLTRPEFKWGKSIQEFILSGGKAAVKKQADKAVDEGTKKAQELLDKELQKNPELKKALPKDLDPGKVLKDGAGGALEGIFGKKKTP